MTKDKTQDAVSILHGRYVKDNLERKAALQEERMRDVTRDTVMTSGQLYVNRCQLAGTSDDHGDHTWELGWAVYADDENPKFPFAIYEDDGRGNGDFVMGCQTIELARENVDRLVAVADEESPGLVDRARQWLEDYKRPPYGSPAYSVITCQPHACAVCTATIPKGARCMKAEHAPFHGTYLCDPCTRVACRPRQNT